MADPAKSETIPVIGEPKGEDTLELAIEHAKRAFALKKYEQAVDHYATALELITERDGDNTPEIADLYLSYGKALLENAITQNSVLGKEQPEDGLENNMESNGSIGDGNGPILSFSGDAEDIEEEVADNQDVTVDMFAQAIAEVDAEEQEREDEEDEDAEPEDDFNAAWEVLDLARAIYEKQNGDDDDEIKLKLADTYVALGDVSLETEKFDQAINDYEAGLTLKTTLLPLSSRQIAEAHYKLSMVLDLTSGRLADAIVHAEKALESVETRLAELRDGMNDQLRTEPGEEEKKDLKGKGKSTGARLIRDNLVKDMTKAQIEAELKELNELKEDLALKVEELKTSPSEKVESASAPALAAEALDKELNPGSTSLTAQMPVNDLTSMVVKKKKKPVDETGAKRKADDEPDSPTEKKMKLDADA